ncbi:MAG TPA: response regulator [Phycisphaerae bacterium]|nr:response regulator [Phycisphaerae bacterium]
MSDSDAPIPPSKILIVDDNAQNLELLEAYLEELRGATILHATNGMEALQKVAADPPDLILLDIMMPRMSGFEVCQKLKSDDKTKDIPIIMVTALHELADIERGVEVGTNDFITKPVNRVDLLTRVRSLLRARHAATDLDREIEYLGGLDVGGQG